MLLGWSQSQPELEQGHELKSCYAGHAKSLVLELSTCVGDFELVFMQATT